jgi:hypothetical protein
LAAEELEILDGLWAQLPRMLDEEQLLPMCDVTQNVAGGCHLMSEDQQVSAADSDEQVSELPSVRGPLTSQAPRCASLMRHL